MSVPGLRLSFNLAVADIGFSTERGREETDEEFGRVAQWEYYIH